MCTHLALTIHFTVVPAFLGSDKLPERVLAT